MAYLTMLLLLAGAVGNIAVLYLLSSYYKKKSFDNVDLTSQVRGEQYSGARGLPDWNLNGEVSARIWWPFWQVVFAQGGDKLAKEKDLFEEQLLISDEVGLDAWRYWPTQEQQAAMRHLLFEVSVRELPASSSASVSPSMHLTSIFRDRASMHSSTMNGVTGTAFSRTES